MPKFVSAQYVWQEEPPPAKMLIRALDDEGGVWWHDDNCTQGDWLDFLAAGGTVRAADEPETKPAP